MGEIGRLIFIRRLGFLKQLRISPNCFDELATSFVNLVNFGPVTPKFKIGKDVHFVVFFKISNTDKLSQYPPDRFSPYGRELILDY